MITSTVYDNRVRLFDESPAGAEKGYIVLSSYVKVDKPGAFALDGCSNVQEFPELLSLYIRGANGGYTRVGGDDELVAVPPGNLTVRVCYAEAVVTSSPNATKKTWNEKSSCLTQWHDLALAPIERQFDVKRDRATVIRVLSETKYRCPFGVKYEKLATSFMDSVSVPYGGGGRDFAELEVLAKQRDNITMNVLVFDDLCRIGRISPSEKTRVLALLDGLNPEFYLVKRVRELLASGSECLVPVNKGWHTTWLGGVGVDE